jgi:S-adenosylmethionine synthetase
MRENRIESAEHVLPGHPDKLCDAAVDAIVDFVRRGKEDERRGKTIAGDPDGQCGLEAAVIFGSVYLTGRVAAREDLLGHLDLPGILEKTYRSAGYGRDAAGFDWTPSPKGLGVITQLCIGPFAEGEREARHLSDDQAVCVGYANALAETGHLPPAHWLARRIARALFDLRAVQGAGQVGPDGKVLATVETDGERWRPLSVSVSLNHHEGSDWLFLRRFAEEAVERACAGRPMPTVSLNGAGMFVAGGPMGDNGLSGKKLVVDAYGPTVPIGGGAWSGKDFHKVDRLGGLLARSLAKRTVVRGLAREAQVSLAYAPGCDRPVEVGALLDGRPVSDLLARLGQPEIGNQAVWRDYVACDASLPELARWGHQRAGMPWEALS